ncbi:MAG: hypothetical protein CMP88_03785 [Gammaproteobacteria bacterium]|nr:hypothetical protein [Gammaproteobacteria bacterium]
MLQSTFDRSQSKRQLTGLRCLIHEEDIRFLVNSIICWSGCAMGIGVVRVLGYRQIWKWGD